MKNNKNCPKEGQLAEHLEPSNTKKLESEPIESSTAQQHWQIRKLKEFYKIKGLFVPTKAI